MIEHEEGTFSGIGNASIYYQPGCPRATQGPS